VTAPRRNRTCALCRLLRMARAPASAATGRHNCMPISPAGVGGDEVMRFILSLSEFHMLPSPVSVDDAEKRLTGPNETHLQLGNNWTAHIPAVSAPAKSRYKKPRGKRRLFFFRHSPPLSMEITYASISRKCKRNAVRIRHE